MFDSTITMGNVLQVVVMLIGGVIALYSVKGDIALLNNIQKNLAEKLMKIDDELEKLSNVTIEIAKQGERMNSQDNRIQEISNRLEDLGKITKLLLPPARLRRSKD